MNEEKREEILLEIRIALADYAHGAWSRWMKYIWDNSRQNKSGSVTIPKPLAERWERQMTTEFASLPEDEQESDYAEADRIMNIIKKALQID